MPLYCYKQVLLSSHPHVIGKIISCLRVRKPIFCFNTWVNVGSPAKTLCSGDEPRHIQDENGTLEITAELGVA